MRNLYHKLRCAKLAAGKAIWYLAEIIKERRSALNPEFLFIKKDFNAMIRKIKLIETLGDLPEEFSIDELVDRLIVIQKVEDAQKQSKEGGRFSEEEAKNMIRKWSK